MLNKISFKFFAIIKLRTLNLLLLSFGLVFLVCQFSYAEEVFTINKENLSSIEKIVETQTYIDLVWGAYVYRKPAYAFPKDPAATPLPYVATSSKKSSAKASVSSLPASSVKQNVATTTTATKANAPTTTSTATGVTQATNTVKAENPVEKATEIKPEVKSEPKVEVKTESPVVPPVSTPTSVTAPLPSPVSTPPVSMPISTPVPVVPATPNVPATGVQPTIQPTVQPTIQPDPATSIQNPLNVPLDQGNGMINVIDGASRPPYESFVSELGELRDM